MPSTVNGIGTNYIGKKKPESHIGVCESCGNEAQLTSYETGLWLVVIFIPIIPLGRKMIFDDCSVCRRHRAMSLAKWKEIGTEAMASAVQGLNNDPGDVGAAVNLIENMKVFGSEAQWSTYADEIRNRFPDDWHVQWQLGAMYEKFGRDADGDACFERALELEPENESCKRAVGVASIHKGDMVRAGELLRFMEEIGLSQDATVLFMLGKGHVAQMNDQEGHRIFSIIVRDFAEWGNAKAFRKVVKDVEGRLGIQKSILPSKSDPGVYVLIVVLALMVAGFFGLNSYLKGRNRIDVLNGFPTNITVSVDGETPFTVFPNQTWFVRVSEGAHNAAVTYGDGTTETIPFTITNSMFERFFGDDTNLLNPRGAATAIWEETAYVDNSRKPPSVRAPLFHFGKPFERLEDVDYRFQPFPKQIKIEGSSAKRTRLGLIAQPPAILFNSNRGIMSLEDQLRFIEHHLTLNPNTKDLLIPYLQVSAISNSLQRCSDFLSKGLKRRPITIQWHRMYQEANQRVAGLAATQAQYDDYLKKEPSSSALLYLVGRMKSKTNEALDFYERATKSDPKNAFAWNAQAHQALARADFTSASTFGKNAITHSRDKQIWETYFNSLLGAKNYRAIQRDLLRKNPGATIDLRVNKWRLLMLAGQGKIQEMRNAHVEFIRTLGVPPTSPFAKSLEQNVLYAEKNYTAHLKWAVSQGDHIETFRAHCELGLIKEAENNPAVSSMKDGFMALLLSIGWHQKGDAEKMIAWRDKAIQQYGSGTADQKRFGVLLNSQSPPSLDDIQNVSMGWEGKVVLLVALGQRHPKTAKRYYDLAEKLLFRVEFPYFYLKRAIMDGRESSGPR